jgi:hypothetical protein
MPDKFEPTRYGSTDGGLSRRLKERDDGRAEWQRKRDEAVEAHIHSSVTRKLLTWAFGIAFTALLVDTALISLGLQAYLGGFAKVLSVFYLPITLVWPNGGVEPLPHLGPVYVPMWHVAAMALYAVVYPVLLAIHAVISEQRTYVPK